MQIFAGIFALITITFVWTEAGRLYLLDGRARSTSEYAYYTDAEGKSRTWEEAKKFCSEEGSELAKVDSREVFNHLRLAIPRSGRYWIDGRDKGTIERFQFDESCSAGKFAFSTLRDKFDLPGNSCLSLLKGNATTSKIQSMNCDDSLWVVCAYPKVGCRRLLPTYTKQGPFKKSPLSLLR